MGAVCGGTAGWNLVMEGGVVGETGVRLRTNPGFAGRPGDGCWCLSPR